MRSRFCNRTRDRSGEPDRLALARGYLHGKGLPHSETRLLRRFLETHHGANRFAFSSDGHRVVTASFDRTAQVWQVFPDTQSLVDDAKARVPRCLTQAQRARFFLRPEPPRWCITGGGQESEQDPLKWQPKWPYQTDQWREWLIAADQGRTSRLPPSASK
jgi:WD40 repeat protein